MSLKPFIRDGLMKIEHLDPAEVSPGEFVDMVRESVEHQNVRAVLIDSLNGFPASHARGTVPRPSPPRTVDLL